MDNKRIKKNALLSSVLALSRSVIMPIGTTCMVHRHRNYGCEQNPGRDLDVALEMNDGQNCIRRGHSTRVYKAEGAPQNEPVLWEPGCTYKLPSFAL